MQSGLRSAISGNKGLVHVQKSQDSRGAYTIHPGGNFNAVTSLFLSCMDKKEQFTSAFYSFSCRLSFTFEVSVLASCN